VPELLSVERIAVYGAGCGAPERQERMRKALAGLWNTAEIRVASDLLGAARAAYGGGKGLILILGTGMNAGRYEDDRLTVTMPSLGFIIGDEGSGADIGKQLYRDVFQGRMPADLAEGLFGPDGPDLQEVIAQVYRGEAPARFLAAQAVKLLPHLEDPYVHGVITTRFRKMCTLLAGFFPEDQRAQVAAVGSVAHGLRDLLGPCLAEQGMALTVALADPMDGLLRYHRERS
jgi:glucosamine kinase